jgi:spore germination cell wall hydrolase CwlJ-like protein
MRPIVQRLIAYPMVGFMTFVIGHGLAMHKSVSNQSLSYNTIDILPEKSGMDDFISSLEYQEQKRCMALNMYFEARNEDSDDAMIAVGYTVLNRVDSERYPDTICDVVFQARRDSHGNPVRNKCQFSWACDGKSDEVNMDNVLERRAWERAVTLAEQVMQGEVDNPIGSATMYHATYVSPYWRRAYTQVAKVESHIFYSQRSRG